MLQHFKLIVIESVKELPGSSQQSLVLSQFFTFRLQTFDPGLTSIHN